MKMKRSNTLNNPKCAFIQTCGLIRLNMDVCHLRKDYALGS